MLPEDERVKILDMCNGVDHSDRVDRDEFPVFIERIDYDLRNYRNFFYKIADNLFHLWVPLQRMLFPSQVARL